MKNELLETVHNGPSPREDALEYGDDDADENQGTGYWMEEEGVETASPDGWGRGAVRGSGAQVSSPLATFRNILQDRQFDFRRRRI
jgi:hypothetical protein